MVDIISAVLIIAGLCIFEAVSSVDNAIINAEVLTTMSHRARRWFLLWGMLFAVFVVRGMLPWLIIWATSPELGPAGALLSTFSSDPVAAEAIEASSPVLLLGGGTFLVFLFLHWLFLEDKYYGLRGERYISSKGIWFYSVVSVLLTLLVWEALNKDQLMALGAVVGSTAFFITHGFRQNAEENEKMLMGSGRSDLSKILYLEVIDATFSIDGVLGAFAFTLSVPLILVGNGLGAIVVRQMTLGNIERIKRYRYLKNGAMYSIFFLGAIMISDSFGAEIPSWLSPIITFAVIGYFLYKSMLENG
jgi:uncharacterized protein